MIPSKLSFRVYIARWLLRYSSDQLYSCKHWIPPAQPSTHTSLSHDTAIYTLTAQWPCVSTNLRCGLESLQEIGVTTLRVLAPRWPPPMLQQQNPREEENSLLPQIHSPCLGYGTEKELTAMCSAVTPCCLPQVQSGYISERGPH